MCIAPSSLLDTSLWLRLERHPTMGSLPIAMAVSSSRDVGARDTITLSSSVSRLRALGPADQITSSLAPDDVAYASRSFPTTSAPEVRHLVGLLRIIQQVSPRYGPLSFNCRWMARVITKTFVRYHGMIDMVAPITNEASASDKIDMMMNFIGKDTREATDVVWSEFQKLFPSESRRPPSQPLVSL